MFLLGSKGCCPTSTGASLSSLAPPSASFRSNRLHFFNVSSAATSRRTGVLSVQPRATMATKENPLKPATRVKYSVEDIRITGPNVDLDSLPDYLKKDCILFYCKETEPLARKVAALSDKVQLGEISWKCVAPISIPRPHPLHHPIAISLVHKALSSLPECVSQVALCCSSGSLPMPLIDPSVSELDTLLNITSTGCRNFADGFPNLFVKDATRIRNRHVAFLASFHNMSTIFEQISVIYQLPRMFIGSFTLVLPYFPTGTAERVCPSLSNPGCNHPCMMTRTLGACSCRYYCPSISVLFP